MSNLLLIDRRIPDISGIVGSLTAETDYIVFDYYADTFQSIQQQINKPYLNVGIAQHNYQGSTCQILDKMSSAIVKDVSFADADLATWDVSMSIPIYVEIDVSSVGMVDCMTETVVWNSVAVDVSSIVVGQDGTETVVWTTEMVDVSSIVMTPVMIETVVWNSVAVDVSSVVVGEDGTETVVWTTEIVDVSSVVMAVKQEEGIVWHKETVESGIEKTAGFIDFLSWLKENGAMNVDFLACFLWASMDWRYVVGEIENKWGVHIRASIDITGWGGNFILESDGSDMIGVYFTEGIWGYKHAFATSILTPQLNRIDMSGGSAYVYWNYGEQLKPSGPKYFIADASFNTLEYSPINNSYITCNIYSSLTTGPMKYTTNLTTWNNTGFNVVNSKLGYNPDPYWISTVNGYNWNAYYYLIRDANVSVGSTFNKISSNFSTSTTLITFSTYAPSNSLSNTIAISPNIAVWLTPNSSQPQIYWSNDSQGITWTLVSLPIITNPLGQGITNPQYIYWNKADNKFYICSSVRYSNAPTYYAKYSSTDGKTWTSLGYISFDTTVINNDMYTVCFSYSLELNVIVAFGRTLNTNIPYVLISSGNGINYTCYNNILNGQQFTVTDLRWISELGLFVAIGSSNNKLIIYSKNGINWNIANNWSNQYFARYFIWNKNLKSFACLTEMTNYNYLTFTPFPTNTQNLQYTTDGINYYDISASQPAIIPNASGLNTSNLVIRVVDTTNQYTANSTTTSGTPLLFPPDAPIITSITQSGTANTLTVNFTQGSNGGGAITGYKYSFNNWLTFTDTATTISPLTITGLTYGQTYSVSIKAHNASYDSTASNTINATVYGISSSILTPQLNRLDTSGTGLKVYWNYGEQINVNSASSATIVSQATTGGFYNITYNPLGNEYLTAYNKVQTYSIYRSTDGINYTATALNTGQTVFFIYNIPNTNSFLYTCRFNSTTCGVYYLPTSTSTSPVQKVTLPQFSDIPLIFSSTQCIALPRAGANTTTPSYQYTNDMVNFNGWQATARTLPNINNTVYNGYHGIWTGTKFILITSIGYILEATNASGPWTSYATPSNVVFTTIEISTTGLIVACSVARIFVSTTGGSATNWTEVSCPVAFTAVNKVLWFNKIGLFAILGSITSATYTPYMLISRNGYNWTSYTGAYTPNLGALTWSDSLGTLIGIYGGSTSAISIKYTCPINSLNLQYTTDSINYYDISASQPAYIPSSAGIDTTILKVRVIDTSYNATANSNQLVNPPDTPVITSIVASNQSAYIYFTVGSTGGTGLTLSYKYTTNNWTTTLTTTSTSSPLQITGLTNNTTYTFSIKVNNGTYESTASNSMSTMPYQIGQPQINRIDTSGTDLKIYFNYAEQVAIPTNGAYYGTITDKSFNSIAYNPNDRKYLICKTSSPTTPFYYSTDFDTWTNLTSLSLPTGFIVYDLFWYNPASRYIFTARDSTKSYIKTLTSSFVMDVSFSITGAYQSRIVQGNNELIWLVYLSATPPTIYYNTTPSTNLATWTSKTLPTGTYYPVDGVWNGTKYILIANTAVEIEATTASGTWTTNTTLNSRIMNCIAYSPELTRICAIGANYCLYSASGGISTNWTQTTLTDTTTKWSKVIWATDIGLFIAIGDITGNSKMMYSKDAITWTAITGATPNYYAIYWNALTDGLYGVNSGATSNTYIMIPPITQKLQYTVDLSGYYDLSASQPAIIYGGSGLTTSNIGIRGLDYVNNPSVLSATLTGTSVIGYPDTPVITSLTPTSTTMAVYFTQGSTGGGTLSGYYYTINGGTTWTSTATITSPITITGLTANQIYTFGLKAYNSLYTSGASNYMTQIATSLKAPSINYIDGSAVYFNYGEQTVFTQSATTGPTASIDAIDGSGQYYLAGYSSGLYKSTNYGVSWSSDTSVLNNRDIKFINGNIGGINWDVFAIVQSTNFSTATLNGTVTSRFAINNNGTSLDYSPNYILLVNNQRNIYYSTGSMSSFSSITLPLPTSPVSIASVIIRKIIYANNKFYVFGYGTLNSYSYLVSYIAENNSTLQTATNWSINTYQMTQQTETIQFVKHSICWSSNFNKFVILGYNTTTNDTYTFISSDGITWTTYLIWSALKFDNILYVSQFRTFLATTTYGFATTVMIQSSDGIEWEQIYSGTVCPQQSIVYDQVQKKIIGVGRPSGTQYIYYSSYPTTASKIQYTTDGYSFTDITPITTPLTISNYSNINMSNLAIRYVDTTNNISPLSNTLTNTSVSLGVATTPSAPTLLTATSQSQSIVITFTDGANGGSAITGYKISTDNGISYTDIGLITSPYTITGLTNGTSYTVLLKSYNVVGDSPASNELSATPYTTPSFPIINSITSGNTTLSINFTDGANGGSAITGYKISTDNGISYTDIGLITSPYTITGLTNGTSYTILLKSYNIAGDSTASNTLNATPYTTPSAPIINSLIGNNKSIIMTFTDGANGGSEITGYKINISSSLGNSETDIGLITSPYTISNLINGIYYTISLKEYNLVGDSYLSTAISATPMNPSPTIINAIGNNSSAIITFYDGSLSGYDVSGYKYRVDNSNSMIYDISFITSMQNENKYFTISSLINGVDYNINLYTIYKNGQSYISNTCSVIPYNQITNTLTSTSSNQSLNYTLTTTSTGYYPFSKYQYKFIDNVWVDISSISNTNANLLNGAYIDTTNYKTGNGSLYVYTASGSPTECMRTSSFVMSATGFSISFWIKSSVPPDATKHARLFVFASQSASSSYISFLTSTGILYFSITKSGTTVNTSYNNVYAFDGTWAFLTITENMDGTITFYKNGVLLNSWVNKPYPTPYAVYGTNSSIYYNTIGGSTSFPLYSFTGNIDDFRFYNGKVLTSTEINTLYNYTTGNISLNNEPTLSIYEAFDKYYYVQSSTLTFSNLTNGSLYTLYLKSDAYDENIILQNYAFNDYIIPVNTSINISNNISQYIHGWVSSNSNAILYLGNGTNLLTNIANSSYSQYIACSLSQNQTNTLYQNVYLTAGDYTASILYIGASSYNTNNTIKLLINNYITDETFATTTNWNQLQLDFTILIDGDYPLNILFTNSSTEQSAILATNVRLTKLNTITKSLTSTPYTTPSAPTITSIVAGNQHLSISFSVSDNGGLPITGYKYSLNGGAYIDAGMQTSPFDITGLTNGTLYTVELKAYSTAGDSPASASVSGTPYSSATAPYITLATYNGQNQLFIYFDDPSNNGGSAIIYYQYSFNGSTFVDVSGTTSPILVSTSSISYPANVSIKAVNATFNVSPVSNTATIIFPPSTPSITSIIAGDSSVFIYFSQSNDGGSAITSYKYSLNNSGTYTTIATTTSPLIITGLVNDTSYNAKIKATNSYYDSAESNVSATVITSSTQPTDPRAPSVPTITGAQYNGTQLFIYFTPPTSQGDSAITQYEYYINNVSNVFTSSLTSPLTITTGLTYPSTVYIEAVNSYGHSPSSNVQTIIFAPSTPEITNIVSGNQQLTLYFTQTNNGGSAITEYRFSTNGGSTFTDVSYNDASGGQYTITGLTNGTTYTVAMSTKNAYYTSATSATYSQKVYTSPDAPVITNVIAGNQQMTVYFTQGSNGGDTIIAYKYSLNDEVYVSVLGASSPLTITGLTNGNTYNVKIVAVNSLNSSASNTWSNIVPYTAPTAPTITNIIAGNQTILVYFTETDTGGLSLVGVKYSLNGGAYQTVATPTSPLTITGLTNGTEYTVAIKTYHTLDSSASATSKSIIPFTKPNAPIITRAEYKDGLLTLTFSASTNTGGLPISKYSYKINNGAFSDYYKP